MKTGRVMARIAYVVFLVPLYVIGVTAIGLEFLAHGLAWVFLASLDCLGTWSGW